MDLSLILFRFAQFSCALLLWGLAMFQVGILPAAWQGAGAVWQRRIAPGLALVNLLAGLGWLADEAAMLGNGPADAMNPAVLWPLLAHTHFGQAFGLHLIIALLLLGISLRAGPRLLAVVAAANLVSLATAGHAAMRGGWAGVLQQGLAGLHLLAAGAWTGGLIALLPCLWLLRSAEFAPLAGAALRAYSRAGHWAVALVFATGAANAALIQTAQGPLHPAPAYLALLALKVALVAAMCAVALANRYVLVPRMHRNDRALALIEAGTLAEIAMAAGALGLVSWFATLSPFAAAVP